MSTVDMKLGALLEMAMDVDREWMIGARCRGWAERPGNDGVPNPWHVDNNKVYGEKGEFKGAELQEWALNLCAGCVAQYDCARFAVETHANYVTSAMPVGSLRWLQKQRNWETIVDVAEAISIPIQTAVVTVRDGAGLVSLTCSTS